MTTNTALTIHEHDAFTGYRTQTRGTTTSIVSPSFPPYAVETDLVVQVRWGSTLRWAEVEGVADVPAAVLAMVEGARWPIEGEPAVEPGQVSYSLSTRGGGVSCATDRARQTWEDLARDAEATARAILEREAAAR